MGQESHDGRTRKPSQTRLLAIVTIPVLLAMPLAALLLHRTPNPDPADRYQGVVKLTPFSGRPLSVGFGGRKRTSARASQPFQVEGSTQTAGIVTAVTEQGQLAGMAVVPKDSKLLKKPGLTIDFRSTALAMVAATPGMSQPDPVVSTIELGLIAETPELDKLTADLASQAQSDAGYLAHPSAQVMSDLDAVEGAFIRKANDFITHARVGQAPRHLSWKDRLVPPAYAEGGKGSGLDGLRPALGPSCDANGDQLRDTDGKESDGVCLKGKDGGATLEMTNPTARWGLYYFGDDFVPAAAALPKTWALPTLQQLIETITKLSAEDVMTSVKHFGGLIGIQVKGDDPAPIEQRLMKIAATWVDDTVSDAKIPKSQQDRELKAVTVGFGRNGEQVRGAATVRFGAATVMTVTTQVVIPLISLALDVRPETADPSGQQQLLKAVLDFAQSHEDKVNKLLSVMSGAEQLSLVQRAANVGQVLADISGASLGDKNLQGAMISYAFKDLSGKLTGAISKEMTNILIGALAAPVAAVKIAIDKGVPAANISLNIIQLYVDSWKYGTTDQYRLAKTKAEKAATTPIAYTAGAGATWGVPAVVVGGEFKNLPGLPGDPSDEQPRPGKPVGWLDRSGKRLLVYTYSVAHASTRRWYSVVDMPAKRVVGSVECKDCQLFAAVDHTGVIGGYDADSKEVLRYDATLKQVQTKRVTGLPTPQVADPLGELNPRVIATRSSGIVLAVPDPAGTSAHGGPEQIWTVDWAGQAHRVHATANNTVLLSETLAADGRHLAYVLEDSGGLCSHVSIPEILDLETGHTDRPPFPPQLASGSEVYVNNVMFLPDGALTFSWQNTGANGDWNVPCEHNKQVPPSVYTWRPGASPVLVSEHALVDTMLPDGTRLTLPWMPETETALAVAFVIDGKSSDVGVWRQDTELVLP